MTPEERRALEHLSLDFTVHRGAIWSDAKTHVHLHNSKTYQYLNSGLDRAAKARYTSAPGAVIFGEDGSGKTHLLRQLRMSTTDRHGFFIQFDADFKGSFEQAVLHSYSASLIRRINNRHTQIHLFLQQLLKLAQIDESDKMLILDDAPTRESVDAVVHSIGSKYDEIDDICRDALRVLCLRASQNGTHRILADRWLATEKESRRGERGRWGISATRRSPREIVFAIARILALCGPTLFAVDQLDTLVKEVEGQTDSASLDRNRKRLSELAHGLMNFNEYSRRTFTVVSCLPSSWEQLQAFGVKSVDGRFHTAKILDSNLTPDAARAIVTAHVEQGLVGTGFKPPLQTWPVSKEAFTASAGMRPRELLRAVVDHVQACLDSGEFELLTEFPGPETTTESDPVAPSPDAVEARYRHLLAEASIDDLTGSATEDETMPEVLSSAFRCFGMEQQKDLEAVPGLSGRQQGVHAEVTFGKRRLAVRALAASGGMPFRGRINWLTEQSGLTEAGGAEAVLIRTSDHPLRAAGLTRIAKFTKDGGRVVQADPNELRVFKALHALYDESPPGLRDWLARARPAGSTRLMQGIFDEHGGQPPPAGAPMLPFPNEVEETAQRIVLGRFEDDTEAEIELEALRKHVAVFAGSGSGKTVLLRRLIEEAALRGVSSIVLDPNNDLARLKLPWDVTPPAWTPADKGKAAAYFDAVEVVVWTPRIEKGRPISLQPLPDFGAVLDDIDEFGAALDTAVATLAPRAKVDGNTNKHEQGRAVLREALAHYARRGGEDLGGFLQLLAEFPGDVVASLPKAPDLAAEMAQTLEANRINDSLFGGTNPPLDPGELLSPSEGSRARISVISLVGLPDTQQRQGFVNQLQMALFAWIKRHPAVGRPLGGLFVMDEAQTFAPSGSMTPCTGSTLALASQARKYGLGLVFATQAPRGIHNQIAGNCATQLIGYLNSPTQIAAVKEMVSARQARALTSTSLSAGEFYLRTEGQQLRRVVAPMCLSFHPSSALTPEEVIALARE
ncbi:helicase HerA domain-containing protein [Glycomyces mayteni]|uniref:Helicase HerA domain-containing protein n=1 Tax=Glycomyces mayteni TaxID=543887 RepID=A0ABW2D1U5_9ACTN|nr:DUF87 domain-containing protein [Glycomyces mayteni]